MNIAYIIEAWLVDSCIIAHSINVIGCVVIMIDLIRMVKIIQQINTG